MGYYEKRHQCVVVVGGRSGGASAVTLIKRLDATIGMKIFEKDNDVYFSSRGPLYDLSGEVENSKNMIMMTPTTFREKYGIAVRVNKQVLSINRKRQTVSVHNADNGETYEQPYDKLLLSPGAGPIVPSDLQGGDQENTFTVRNVRDSVSIKAYKDNAETKKVVVVVGSFTGIKVAEKLIRLDKKVNLVEQSGQILHPFDEEIGQNLHKELDDHGIELQLSSEIIIIIIIIIININKGIRLQHCTQQTLYPADSVIIVIGVSSNARLLVAADLDAGKSDVTHVNKNYQTNVPDFYAVSDASEVFDPQSHMFRKLALADPAQFETRAAADHICEKTEANHGFIGTLRLYVFEQNAATVGLSEFAAVCAGSYLDTVLIFHGDKVTIMLCWHYIALKLIFEQPSDLILGAQVVVAGNTEGRINVISAMILMNATVYDLKDLNLCNSPVYSKVRNPINQMVLVAINIREGRFRKVHVPDMRKLVQNDSYIIDVHEIKEYATGHIKGTRIIPLTKLHNRKNEIPGDILVYVHYHSSQHSYYALCCIEGFGVDNIINISGVFLAITL